jgi:hypothetical protein
VPRFFLVEKAMDKHKKYLLRVARTIQAGLLGQPNPQLADAEATLSRLCGKLEGLKHAIGQLSICRQRGWNLAGQQLLRDLRWTVQDLGTEVTRNERVFRDPTEASPTLRQVYEELIQTEQEFDDVEYRRSEGKLVSTTAPIVLEDIRLGRFEIQLVLDRLGTPDPHDALRIAALEPNPASSDERVTHPHVSNEQLCAGDASAPLRAALISGRICDVFLLARSVLENYNAGSPFVSLANWDGTPCSDCGYCASADDTFYCEGCQQDYCEECVSYCRSCDTNLCRGCLRKCSLCDEYTCESCLQSCRRCGASACPACLDDNVCTTCIEKEKQNEQESDHDQQCIGEDTRDGQATTQAVAAGADAAATTGSAVHADGVGQAGVLPRPRRHRNRRVRRHSAA